ncbi:TPA: hypothetical protein ACKKAV_001671, partial [Neisseria gonorrhoeae]
RIGDILTHRHTHRKVVVSCIQEHHLLLVDADGRISKIRTQKAVNRYCRSVNDVHSHKNASVALNMAIRALDNDKRIFTRLGLRMSQKVYLDKIYSAIKR